MRSLLECLGGIYLTLLAIGAVTTAHRVGPHPRLPPGRK